MEASESTFTPGRDWVLAGNAVFTAKNPDGESYTFRVRRVIDEEGKRPPIWFGSILTGADNESDSSYTYLGVVAAATGALRATRASGMAAEARPFKVLAWALKVIWAGLADKLPHGYGIHGAGRCGRCGRLLTRPEGIAPDGYRLGFGPDCFEKITGGRA